MAKLKVAYILFRFPSITETFIAEEMQKIQETGVELCIYSLLAPTGKIIQPVSASLLPLVKTAPGILHPSLWAAQARYVFKSPKAYFGLLRTLMQQPAPGVIFYLKRFVIYLKSIWIADNLKSRNVQIIHTHFAWLSSATAWIVGSLLQLPFTVTTHAFDIYSDENDLFRLATTQAAHVVTISQYNKQVMMVMNRHLNAEKIKVIHCGVDLSFFTKPANSSALNTPPQITSVGSLIEKKGHEILIRSCAILKERGFPFNCVIVGSGFLEAHLEKLIHQLNLEDCVNLAGSQSSQWVRDRLDQSDLFVLACTHDKSGGQDGIPVAMMEALAMGVPVITTPVSGIPELIKDGVTGLLVEERDPVSLAEAIMKILHDITLRQHLQDNGYTLVKNEFDIRINVGQLSQVFSEVAREHQKK